MRLRRLFLVVLVVTGLIAAFAGGTALAGQFVDVSPGGHSDSIDAIAAAGITLGCNPPANDNYCPNGSVTRAQMASFLARGLGLNSGATKNFPKANARSDIQSYCAAAAASPRSFVQSPCQRHVTDIEVLGSAPSATLGIDGLPLISFISGGDLKLARCLNPSCTSFVIRTLANPTEGQVGVFLSIVVGPDGIPMTAYANTMFSDIHLARCTDPVCTSTTQIGIAIDSTIEFGAPSLAIGSDGFPVIAFHDYSSSLVRLAHCQNLTCSSAVDFSILGPAEAGADIAIGTNGFPMVAYRDTGNDLKFMHCTSLTCSTKTTVTLDDAGNVDEVPSLAIGSDGFPVVGYRGGFSTKVAHCTVGDCATRDLATVWQYSADQFNGTSGTAGRIAVGVDGLPVVAFIAQGRPGESTLRIARCRDVACKSATSTGANPSGQNEAAPAIVVGPIGHAVVAYGARPSLDSILRVTREVGG